MIEKTITFLVNIVLLVVKTTASTIEQWHYDAAQAKQAQLATQAVNARFNKSVMIQRDLARIIQHMTPPDGLTYVHDPRNLTFVPDYNNGENYYAFLWQKTRRKFLISETTLISLAKRINQRILQMPSHLWSIGYSDSDIATDYPALYNGFEVADIQDSDECVYVIIRLH